MWTLFTNLSFTTRTVPCEDTDSHHSLVTFLLSPPHWTPPYSTSLGLLCTSQLSCFLWECDIKFSVWTTVVGANCFCSTSHPPCPFPALILNGNSAGLILANWQQVVFPPASWVLGALQFYSEILLKHPKHVCAPMLLPKHLCSSLSICAPVLLTQWLPWLLSAAPERSYLLLSLHLSSICPQSLHVPSPVPSQVAPF